MGEKSMGEKKVWVKDLLFKELTAFKFRPTRRP